MPERKHFFLMEVFPYTVSYSHGGLLYDVHAPDVGSFPLPLDVGFLDGLPTSKLRVLESAEITKQVIWHLPFLVLSDVLHVCKFVDLCKV